jgi:hypothetical protein
VILVSIGFNDTPWNSFDDSCDANPPPVDVGVASALRRLRIERAAHTSVRNVLV